MQNLIDATKYKLASGEEVRYPFVYANGLEIAEQGVSYLLSDYRKLFKQVSAQEAELDNLKKVIKNLEQQNKKNK